jgi:hypothetical protein
MHHDTTVHLKNMEIYMGPDWYTCHGPKKPSARSSSPPTAFLLSRSIQLIMFTIRRETIETHDS